jgi:hypothetical protein
LGAGAEISQFSTAPPVEQNVTVSPNRIGGLCRRDPTDQFHPGVSLGWRHSASLGKVRYCKVIDKVGRSKATPGRGQVYFAAFIC